MVWNCELWLLNRTAQHQELHLSSRPYQCWETVENENLNHSKPGGIGSVHQRETTNSISAQSNRLGTERASTLTSEHHFSVEVSENKTCIVNVCPWCYNRMHASSGAIAVSPVSTALLLQGLLCRIPVLPRYFYSFCILLFNIRAANDSGTESQQRGLQI